MIGVEQGQGVDTAWNGHDNFWLRLLKDIPKLEELSIVVNPVMYGNLKHLVTFDPRHVRLGEDERNSIPIWRQINWDVADWWDIDEAAELPNVKFLRLRREVRLV